MKGGVLAKQGLLLRYLLTGRCYTRADLAKKTGFNKMTISNLVGCFIEKEILQEQQPLPDKNAGRNPIGLGLHPKAPTLLGLQIHRDYCKGVLCDLQLNPLAEKAFAINAHTADDFVENLLGLVQSLLTPTVLGVGIATIGPVDGIAGTLLNPPSFYGIENLCLKALVEKTFALPTLVDGQYNCAALAQLRFGKAELLNDFLFVGLSKGIGAAVVSGGRLYRGAGGLGVELGHLSVDINGTLCPCGARGCLETYCSADVLCRDYEKDIPDFAALCQNPAAQPYLLERCRILAKGLVSCVNLFHTKAILLGDEGVCLPDTCLAAIQEQVQHLRLAKGFDQLLVQRPSLGQRAQLLGAAALVLEPYFAGERQLEKSKAAFHTHNL